jgi:hypothetical protein
MGKLIKIEKIIIYYLIIDYNTKIDKMQTLINMLSKFRSGFKLREENFSHAASIFLGRGKERCFKFH